MKILVVEDEPNYADTLEMFIDQLGYDLVGICDNGKDAIINFEEHAPDVVLMDINLSGELTGIDLASIFQKKQATPIIFITSYDDPETFAKAKGTAPFAYLIKPFRPDELERSIELAIHYAHGDGQSVFENSKQMVIAPNSFFVKDRNKLHKIDLSDILWIEVEDKYCMVQVNKRKFTLRQSLKELAEKLDPKIFAQTHRSFIVNTAHIEDIDVSQYTVRVKGNEIPLGRAYKEELVQRIQLL